MLEQGEPGAGEEASCDAAVRLSAARQDDIETRLKQEFVSLLKSVYFSLLSVEAVDLERFLWV